MMTEKVEELIDVRFGNVFPPSLSSLSLSPFCNVSYMGGTIVFGFYPI